MGQARALRITWASSGPVPRAAVLHRPAQEGRHPGAHLAVSDDVVVVGIVIVNLSTIVYLYRFSFDK